MTHDQKELSVPLPGHTVHGVFCLCHYQVPSFRHCGRIHPLEARSSPWTLTLLTSSFCYLPQIEGIVVVVLLLFCCHCFCCCFCFEFFFFLFWFSNSFLGFLHSRAQPAFPAVHSWSQVLAPFHCTVNLFKLLTLKLMQIAFFQQLMIGSDVPQAFFWVCL